MCPETCFAWIIESIGGLFEPCAGDSSFTSVFVGRLRGLCSAMWGRVYFAIPSIPDKLSKARRSPRGSRLGLPVDMEALMVSALSLG